MAALWMVLILGVLAYTHGNRSDRNYDHSRNPQFATDCCPSIATRHRDIGACRKVDLT